MKNYHYFILFIVDIMDCDISSNSFIYLLHRRLLYHNIIGYVALSDTRWSKEIVGPYVDERTNKPYNKSYTMLTDQVYDL